MIAAATFVVHLDATTPTGLPAPAAQWGALVQLVALADARGARLSLAATPQWAAWWSAGSACTVPPAATRWGATCDAVVRAWLAEGHSVGLHRHPYGGPRWDGYGDVLATTPGYLGTPEDAEGAVAAWLGAPVRWAASTEFGTGTTVSYTALAGAAGSDPASGGGYLVSAPCALEVDGAQTWQVRQRSAHVLLAPEVKTALSTWWPTPGLLGVATHPGDVDIGVLTATLDELGAASVPVLDVVSASLAVEEYAAGSPAIAWQGCR